MKSILFSLLTASLAANAAGVPAHSAIDGRSAPGGQAVLVGHAAASGHTIIDGGATAGGRPMIIGGQPMTARDPIQRSTAALYSPSASGPGGSLCTASLIGKNTAVTAAHCLPKGSYAPVMIFGNDVRSPSAVQRPVTGEIVNPAYGTRGTSMDQGDIAVVKFGGKLPAGYKPAVLQSNDSVKRGETAVLAGYGVSDAATHAGAGILRKTSVAVASPRAGKSEMILDQTHGRGACHGDSGGPAYVMQNGKMVLAGVTNRSYPNSASDNCAHKVVYTKVADYKPWIQQSEAALANGSGAMPSMDSASAAVPVRALASRATDAVVPTVRHPSKPRIAGLDPQHAVPARAANGRFKPAFAGHKARKAAPIAKREARAKNGRFETLKQAALPPRAKDGRFEPEHKTAAPAPHIEARAKAGRTEPKTKIARARTGIAGLEPQAAKGKKVKPSQKVVRPRKSIARSTKKATIVAPSAAATKPAVNSAKLDALTTKLGREHAKRVQHGKRLEHAKRAPSAKQIAVTRATRQVAKRTNRAVAQSANGAASKRMNRAEHKQPKHANRLSSARENRRVAAHVTHAKSSNVKRAEHPRRPTIRKTFTAMRKNRHSSRAKRGGIEPAFHPDARARKAAHARLSQLRKRSHRASRSKRGKI